MFTRLIVKNFASFREETELSLVSTARKDAPTWRMPTRHSRHGILPAVGIWGANATGKSNLLAALTFMRSAVKSSQAKWEATRPVAWNPWRLAREETSPPTKLQLEFIIDDIRYLFGFSIGAAGFLEEWLYRWTGAKQQILYHRDVSEPGGNEYYFGPSFKGRRHAITEIVRPNSLYLSAAAQQNHPLLLSVYKKIVEGIHEGRPIDGPGYPVFEPDEPLLDTEMRPVLLQMLRSADLGICDIRVEDIKFNDFDALKGASEIFTAEFLQKQKDERGRGAKKQQVILLHGTIDDPWELKPQLESQGTHILLARIAEIVRVLRAGTLLVIDELETHLHPQLISALVSLFTEEKTNPKGAQLLFTTHNRELLEQLRTDEVFLVDKQRNGESVIAAASDFKGTRSRDKLRLAQEQGTIGGVPVLGDLASAFTLDSI